MNKNITISVAAAHKEERLPLLFQGKNPQRIAVGATSKYFVFDQKPWFPVMGEMHYSRYPHAYWEESLLKMQAGGISIVAAYVFWLHHEEIEGEMRWDGNCNLRKFVELCAKHNYPLLLRIGPWCHGEARNGGFPDWLLHKDFETRTNDERYFAYVRKWYAAIYEQIQGFLYKDGGTMIGIQLENEYGHCGGLRGEDGKTHIRTLKRIAREIGFDVPLYTTTGWGGGVVVEGETLPVMAAYAEQPWAQHTRRLDPTMHYLFTPDRDDHLVGADLATQEAMLTYDPERHPYAMAELGPGNQCTYHRRPILTPADAEAMTLVKLGSGANLIGYYMFHGGTNPLGKLSTMQESKATGYLNDLPELSYDFQAPIREYGQIAESYRALKCLHLFLRDFGAEFALTQSIFPPENATAPENTETLRFAARDAGGSGYLFVNNYQRHLKMGEKPACRFTVNTGEQTIEFPEFTLISGRYAFFPYNFRMAGVTLQAATAQPLCRLLDGDVEYYVFFSYSDAQPQYIFRNAGIAQIDGANVLINETGATIAAQITEMGRTSVITLRDDSGKTVKVVTLTRREAESCWKGHVFGRERLILTDADATFSEDGLTLCSTNPNGLSFAVFPDVETPLELHGQPLVKRQDGIFTAYSTPPQVAQHAAVAVRELAAEGDARQWEIAIDMNAMPRLNDLFLQIEFKGDVAKLFLDNAPVADWFYDGRIWEIGLKRFADRLRVQPFRLKITPLSAQQEIYFDLPPTFQHGRALALKKVAAVPQYVVLFHK